MTYENFIKGRLVQYAANAAYHYGGTQVMCAVAQVLANRVKAGWGEWNTIIDTADNTAGTIIPAAIRFPIDPRDLTFRRMLSLVDDIYMGTADDSSVNVEDDRGKTVSLYYAELNNINNDWFLENITGKLDRHPRLAAVGPLTFFG